MQTTWYVGNLLTWMGSRDTHWKVPRAPYSRSPSYAIETPLFSYSNPWSKREHCPFYNIFNVFLGLYGWSNVTQLLISYYHGSKKERIVQYQFQHPQGLSQKSQKMSPLFPTQNFSGCYGARTLSTTVQYIPCIKIGDKKFWKGP
jgi:hypothetical protein